MYHPQLKDKDFYVESLTSMPSEVNAVCISKTFNRKDVFYIKSFTSASYIS